MAWRDEWLRASLDGIEFESQGVRDRVGRRTVIQEFPGTDTVRSQDLGPETDRFTIECRIRGPEYKAQRKRLEDVLRREGDKLLVHPDRGQIRVALADGGSVEFEDRWQSECRFRLDVVKTGDGGSTASTVARVNQAATTQTAIEEVEAEVYPVLGEFAAAQNTENTFEAFRSGLAAAQHALSFNLGRVYNRTTPVRSVAAQVKALGDTALLYADIPGDAMALIGDLTGQVLDSALATGSALDDVSEAFQAAQRTDLLLSMARYLSGTEAGLPALSPGLLVTPLGPSSFDAIAQHKATACAAMRTGAIIRLSHHLTTRNLESKTQAEAALRALRALLYGLYRGSVDALAWAVDDATYARLETVVASVTRYLTESSVGLPTIQEHRVRADTSAMILADQLYGDASRWPDLVTRNRLQTPTRIRAGTVVEYLSDG